ncbi:MAG: 50S ribosomal protein L32 [Thermostichales cyanobacterium SZTDM-1c_bins_54]
MAVPKKKHSKARSRRHYAVWKAKIGQHAQKAYSLGKAILSQRNTSFYYPSESEAAEEQE